MKKQYQRINLLCVMHDTEITDGESHQGVLTCNDANGFCFEEARPQRRSQRNPRLYEGEFLTMTKRKNGQYGFYFKPFDAQRIDHDELLVKIYAEVHNALARIN